MPRIEEVAFSKLVCNGKVYRAPLLVFPDHVDGRWWRKDGTVFGPGDFDSVIESRPEVVVLGIGFTAKVRVPDETRERFEAENIECIVADTAEAVGRFNSFAGSKKVVGAFHLL